MKIEQINQVLKKLGKRVKIAKYRGEAEHTKNIKYYQLNNGKMLVVFFDNEIIKSILIQNRIGRYTVGINGQEGTNTSCIYYANYDYEKHQYEDIFAVAY